MLRRPALLVALVAVPLAVAACGGGGSGSTGASGASGASGSAPLSKAEFVSRANAICKTSNAKVEALKAPPSGGAPRGFVPYLTQIVPIDGSLVTQFEALTPPSNLQSDWDKVVAHAKASQASVEKLLAAAKANDASQFQAVAQQTQATSGDVDSLARSMGLTQCVAHPQPQG